MCVGLEPLAYVNRCFVVYKLARTFIGFGARSTYCSTVTTLLDKRKGTLLRRDHVCFCFNPDY